MTTEEFYKTNNTASTPCKSCGAPMVYKPGTNLLVCTYCTSTQEINQENFIVNEIDFESFEKPEMDAHMKIVLKTKILYIAFILK